MVVVAQRKFAAHVKDDGMSSRGLPPDAAIVYFAIPPQKSRRRYLDSTASSFLDNRTLMAQWCRLRNLVHELRHLLNLL